MAIVQIKGNWRQFWRAAKRIVRAQAGRDVKGKTKMKGAIDDFVEWGDHKLKWGKGPLGRLAEWGDGLVLRAIATVLIQAAHDVMKADGVRL